MPKFYAKGTQIRNTKIWTVTVSGQPGRIKLDHFIYKNFIFKMRQRFWISALELTNKASGFWVFLDLKHPDFGVLLYLQ